MNPRPKTINLGFYILISRFIIRCCVSLEPDTRQYTLIVLACEVQEPSVGDSAKSTPRPEICGKDFSGTEAALSSYGIVIIVCDYI